jgi:hypothetical protein
MTNQELISRNNLHGMYTKLFHETVDVISQKHISITGFLSGIFFTWAEEGQLSNIEGYSKWLVKNYLSVDKHAPESEKIIYSRMFWAIVEFTESSKVIDQKVITTMKVIIKHIDRSCS